MRALSVSALALSVIALISVSLARIAVPSSAAATGCSSPTELGLSGAMLGPLRIRGFSGGGYAKIEFKPGYPTKVLLVPRLRWVGLLSLRGVRCSDGRALRFAYNDEELPRPPLSQQDFARAGTLVPRLPPPPRTLKLWRYGYTGYMLFSDEGNWRIRVYRKGQLVGAITVAVTPFSS
jgi:hypothetical protein